MIRASKRINVMLKKMLKKIKITPWNISGGFLKHNWRKKLQTSAVWSKNQTVVNAIVNGLFIHSTGMEVLADEAFPNQRHPTPDLFSFDFARSAREWSCNFNGIWQFKCMYVSKTFVTKDHRVTGNRFKYDSEAVEVSIRFRSNKKKTDSII